MATEIDIELITKRYQELNRFRAKQNKMHPFN